jgi:hypothetical protein
MYNEKTFKENKSLDGTKFSSLRKLAAMMPKGHVATVQETSGTWEGWYRQVGVESDGINFWHSRPAMEY